MLKTKQWLGYSEKESDNIIKSYVDGILQIMLLINYQMLITLKCGIDEHNVDEVLEMAKEVFNWNTVKKL